MLMKFWCFLWLLECQVALTQSGCGGKRNGARRPKTKQVSSNNVEKLPGFSNKDKDCILEMAFLLDSSEDVSNYYHEQQKKFVLETVNKMKGLQLTSGHTLQWKMSLLQYSSTVLMKQTFHSWEGPEGFQTHVASITPTGPGAYLTYAITNLTRLYKTESIPGSTKVAVLFMDGEKQARNTDVSAASRKAKNQGIVFLIVGLSTVAEETANAATLYRLARVPASQVVFSLQEKEVVEKVLKKTKELTEEKCLKTSACLCEKGQSDFPCPGKRGDCDNPETKGDWGSQGHQIVQGERSPPVKELPQTKSEVGSQHLPSSFPVMGIHREKGEPGSSSPRGLPPYPGEVEAPGQKKEARVPSVQDPSVIPGISIPKEKGNQGQRGMHDLPGTTGAPWTTGSKGKIGPKDDQVLTREDIIKLIKEICGCTINCKDIPMELVFVINSPESMEPENLEVIKDFVISLVDKVTVGRNATRIGLVLYGSEVQLRFGLDRFITKQDVKHSIQKISYMGKGTYTGTAIHKATREAFWGARTGVRKVAVVITDGQTEKSEAIRLEAAVREAHAASIEIYAIGIVNASDPRQYEFVRELNLIASDPDREHMYLSDSFTALPDLEFKLANQFCANEHSTLISGQIRNDRITGKPFQSASAKSANNLLHNSNRVNGQMISSEKQKADMQENYFGSNKHSQPTTKNKESLVLLYEDYEEKHERVKQLPISSANLQENAWNPQCQLNLDQGSCRAYVIKWYYDKKANACAQFWYGGCNGNANRYNSEDECVKACVFFHRGKV
ncbi:collagen alpha-1(XXVIII) chain-like [Dromiciops gliroides]|uniref:collagen alpha-1(XXVIII) chain-like n=1 Tax=Dromiciops gliroides TaxID=33562 RepID=UPI001CC7E625|nr:collagen alpha-1(XXVIII) chain-like [Dromiciops gliroides]